MKDCKACVGCRNNFYNENNSLGVKQCWSVPTAKIVTRYELSTHTPMWFREAYVKVRKPDCYHRTGSVFMKDIPSYAKTPAQRKVILANQPQPFTHDAGEIAAAVSDGRCGASEQERAQWAKENLS